MPDPTSRSALLASTAPVHPTIPPSGRKAARRARRAELRATASDPLLTAEEAAAEAGRALSTFWRDVRRGTLPAPYYVTPRAARPAARRARPRRRAGGDAPRPAGPLDP